MTTVLIEEALAAAAAIIQAVLAAKANGDAHVDVEPIVAKLKDGLAADDAAAQSELDKKFPKGGV